MVAWLPQKLKSTFFEKFSNGVTPKAFEANCHAPSLKFFAEFRTLGTFISLGVLLIVHDLLKPIGNNISTFCHIPTTFVSSYTVSPSTPKIVWFHWRSGFVYWWHHRTTARGLVIGPYLSMYRRRPVQKIAVRGPILVWRT